MRSTLQRVVLFGAVCLCAASARSGEVSAQVGVVTPASGPWHTFVTITGDGVGTATGARVVWYPGDDASKPPLGSSSATLRTANPKTGAQIEIPEGAGGPQGGVIRIFLAVPRRKEPLFVGRFTVDPPGAGTRLRTARLDGATNADTSSTRRLPGTALTDRTPLDDRPPAAVLAAPAEIGWGAPIALDGTGSTDVGGHIAKYEWSQVGGQGGIWGSTTVMTDVPTVTCEADLDRPFALGQHTFQLIVTDDSGNRSAPATATVTVRDDRAPTAVLDLPAEAGLRAGVVLEGRRSFDVAGRVVAFEWTRLGGPGGLTPGMPLGTAGTTFPVPSMPSDPMRPGVHTFQLVVTDDSGNRSAPDTASVTVTDDVPPTAALSVPEEVGWAVPIALDGTGSVDHEGRIARYEWTQVGGQGGIWGATTATTDVPTVTFQADLDRPFTLGEHTFRLVVIDDSGNRSVPVQAHVTVRDDRAPTAVLDAPATAVPGQDLVLEGRRSFDVGGRVVGFEWTHVSGPGGLPLGAAFVTSATSFIVPSTPRDPMRPGGHTFRLVVTDDSGNRSPPVVASVTVSGGAGD